MGKITEPITMLTDYILAIETLVLAILIFNSSDDNSSRILWGLAFVIATISAILGGTSHGFKEFGNQRIQNFIWKLTVFSIGLGAILMFLGTLIARFSPSTLRVVVIIIVAISYGVYFYWMRSHDEFIFVIAYYVPYLVFILIIELFFLSTISAPFMISGIIITFMGFAVQASRKGIHTNFNHNDIFHVVQMIAMFVFYRGVINLTDNFM